MKKKEVRMQDCKAEWPASRCKDFCAAEKRLWKWRVVSKRGRVHTAKDRKTVLEEGIEVSRIVCFLETENNMILDGKQRNRIHLSSDPKKSSHRSGLG